MKTKGIIIFMTLFLTAGTSFAQEDWFDKFADHKDITQVTISKALLKMAPSMASSVNMNGVEIKDVINKLEQIDIFTSDKEEAAGMMRKETTAFFKKNKSYEVLMKVKDGNDNVTFYCQNDGEFIKSLVMVVDDGNECSIIRLLGKFTIEDISKITEKREELKN